MVSRCTVALPTVEHCAATLKVRRQLDTHQLSRLNASVPRNAMIMAPATRKRDHTVSERISRWFVWPMRQPGRQQDCTPHQQFHCARCQPASHSVLSS